MYIYTCVYIYAVICEYTYIILNLHPHVKLLFGNTGIDRNTTIYQCCNFFSNLHYRRV